MDKITSIRVKASTKQKLAGYGKKGDSFEEIIINLMEKNNK